MDALSQKKSCKDVVAVRKALEKVQKCALDKMCPIPCRSQWEDGAKGLRLLQEPIHPVLTNVRYSRVPCSHHIWILLKTPFKSAVSLVIFVFNSQWKTL